MLTFMCFAQLFELHHVSVTSPLLKPYLLHAVALSLVTQGGEAEKVSLLHLGVDLVVCCLVPGGGHQVNRHL